MNRDDILSLIGGGTSPDDDDMRVACLLKSGYGCVGYFKRSVNDSLSAAIVLLNMRLVDLRADERHSRRGRVADFNDFQWEHRFAGRTEETVNDNRRSIP